MFGLKDDSPQLTHVRGPTAEDACHYPFKQLSFEGVAVTNPNITLVPDREAQLGRNAPDLIIGTSILRQLHLYIAYHEKNLTSPRPVRIEGVPLQRPG